MHTSAYASVRQHTEKLLDGTSKPALSNAIVSTRQHTSAYTSIRQHTPAYASIRSNPALSNAIVVLSIGPPRSLSAFGCCCFCAGSEAACFSLEMMIDEVSAGLLSAFGCFAASLSAFSSLACRFSGAAVLLLLLVCSTLSAASLASEQQQPTARGCC